MNRIALALAVLASTSGAVLANDFSGALAFPTYPAQAAGQIDRTSTFSIVKAEKKHAEQDKAQSRQEAAPTRQ